MHLSSYKYVRMYMYMSMYMYVCSQYMTLSCHGIVHVCTGVHVVQFYSVKVVV